MIDIRFKACVRCKGDMFREQDPIGFWELRCMQCGHRKQVDWEPEERRLFGKDAAAGGYRPRR